MKPIRAARTERLTLSAPLATLVPALSEVLTGGFFLGGAALPPDDPRARWDLIGAAPSASFRAWRADPSGPRRPRRARIRLVDDQGVREEEDDFAHALCAFVEEARRGWASCGSPLPLPGGLVGYLGYECGQMLEALPPTRRPDAGVPDALLHVHDWVIGVRRATGDAWLALAGRGDDVTEAERDLEGLRARAHALLAAAPRPQARHGVAKGVRTDAVDPAGYRARVARAKALIDAGEAFEICLTNRVHVPVSAEPAAIFHALAEESPAPYAAYFAFPEGTLVSSSPERFVRVDPGGVIESRPIKGTRPRAADPRDDQALHDDLARAEKDAAENTMIVDLVRNDLGKVSRFGTVTVPELCAVESYATVHQLVSTVRGELADGKTAVDAVLACFPPGSMTGAPKIEAMARIDELEPEERGPYAGALGYFAFDGTADFSVVIRTALVRDGMATLGTGGAVTTDSSADAEHAETEVKLRGLLRAIDRAEAR